MKRKSLLPVVAGVLLGLAAPEVHAREGDLIAFLPFAVPSPQDIAYDTDDGTLWVVTFLDRSVYHYSADLSEVLARYPAPFGSNQYFTGVAFNSIDHTILVADSATGKIYEMDKSGVPTGREILPEFEPVVNPNGRPLPMGMAFDPYGDNENGSIYVVEAVGTLIYELNLLGQVIRRFSHPDDPDGFPGSGAAAPVNHDVDLIYEDEQLVGFYVTAGTWEARKIRRLDADGRYTGIYISTQDAGGSVSGILRRPFLPPGAAEPVDAFVCVVESNSRIALLEGGEPEFREVLDFACTTGGRTMELTWTNPQAYDAIEIFEGCNLLASLPGTETSWSTTFDVDGVYDVSLVAYAGSFVSEPPPCRIVVGGGEVLATGEILSDPSELLFPLDITSTDDGLLLVSAAVLSGSEFEGRILIYDTDFTELGAIDVSADFAGPEDYISGVAHARREGDQFIYIFNASTSTIGVLDSVGALVETIEAGLPNLETDPEAEPDYGFVVGMTYDPDGAGGSGSLWVVEVSQDWIYELDLEGNILRDFPHPYLLREPPPEDSPYGIQSSGITRLPWDPEGGLAVGGGALRESGQPRIFNLDKETGQALPGTEIPTAGIRQFGSTSTFPFTAIEKDGEPRFVAITGSGQSGWLLEVRASRPDVPAPLFLSARQESYPDEVTITFQPAAAYDSVEVLRDCEVIAELPGEASGFLDQSAPPGLHDYAVRGVLNGVSSDVSRVTMRTGVGAVLDRKIIWPTLSPQQLTRDPQDGSFFVVGNYPRQERTIHRFDREFNHQSSWEVDLEGSWQIATLAVRHKPGQIAEVHYIAWQQPVPLGEAGSQPFFLNRDSLSGERLGEVEITLPVPDNGFIQYPTGLCWNPVTDTFIYLERNSKTFIEITPEGQELRQFQHPDPPFQNFVFALGVSVVPEKQTIFYTTASRYDHRVTWVREMTLEGVPTGVEIPLEGLPVSVTGISVHGPDLVAVGTQRFAELMKLKAFEDLPAPFLRGDSDANGDVNLTDAITTLNYLFLGGPVPPCEDGADADDSGGLDLTDAIATLMFLFLGGDPLPPPFPDPGADPSPDSLTCAGG